MANCRRTFCSSGVSSLHECSIVARIDRCRSGTPRAAVSKKARDFWISLAISSHVRIRTQAAASSIPKGKPSTNSQIRTIANKSFFVGLNPTEAWFARWINRATALLDSSSSGWSPWGRGSPWTSKTHSACNFKGCREVTSILIMRVPSKMSSMRSTQLGSMTKCSKLSRISSSSRCCR